MIVSRHGLQRFEKLRKSSYLTYPKVRTVIEDTYGQVCLLHRPHIRSLVHGNRGSEELERAFEHVFS